MKLILFCVAFMILGCNSNNPVEAKPFTNNDNSKVDHSQSGSTDTINHSYHSEVVQRNYRDQNGLKQGIWDFKENGHLKGFETYTNDTLDGAFRHWINYPGGIYEGSYKKGLKNGICKTYENDTILVMVHKYRQGESLWAGYPSVDNHFDAPVKGFDIESDSVLIECPYSNDTIWYKGVFIKKEPVGIHRMYYPNGRLKFVHNYNTGKVKAYNSQGKLIEVP